MTSNNTRNTTLLPLKNQNEPFEQKKKIKKKSTATFGRFPFDCCRPVKMGLMR